ncbi:MAG: nitroreductase family protein [Nitrosopumilus sp.]|nr:nitroreductase family protein [Nitrosopumilus sp.]
MIQGFIYRSNLEESIIDNHAVTDYPIHDLLRKRWSARAFSARKVENIKLFSILEAARWTPSSRNEQPWRYIVFTSDNPSRLLEAQSGLLESNSFAKQAPILICAITKKPMPIVKIQIGYIFMTWGPQMRICSWKVLIKV